MLLEDVPPSRRLRVERAAEVLTTIGGYRGTARDAITDADAIVEALDDVTVVVDLKCGMQCGEGVVFVEGLRCLEG